MRKWHVLFLVVILGIYANAAFAQRGCCSSHGGVCGCSCCDGTPLSEICRPYFPCLPKAPSGLNAVSTLSTQAFLTWLDNSSDESSFRIESRAQDQTNFREIGSVGRNVTQAKIVDLTPSTTYLFRIRAQNGSGYSSYSNIKSVTTLAEGAACQAPAVCFGGNRFKVEGRWQTANGASGNATVVRLTDDSGYLWFFTDANVEAVFKVLNACAVNNSFWFFAGGLTNVQTTITVTDTKTGAQKVYTNPQGTAFKAIQDTAAFNTCP